MADTGMPFANLMGVEVVEREKTRVVGKLVVREDLCTAGGILHGGAYMAFADALGAIGGVLNLQPGTRTTTLESKTNFLGSAKVGSTVTGEARRSTSAVGPASGRPVSPTTTASCSPW